MEKFLKLFSHFTAHGIFFKQTEINLIVPIVNGAPNIHEKNRLIKFEVVDSPVNSSQTFSLKEKQDYLHLNAISGELWFHRSKWNMIPRETWKIISKEIVIEFKSSVDESTAKTTLNLHFTPYENFKDFCIHHMCFYDGITFNALEDFNDNFKTRDVGKVAPKFHHRICKDYKVEYKLLNGKLCKSSIEL